MKSHVIAAACGLLFGLGLAVSQMVNPSKVLNFLDFFGSWDPSLLLVIGAATGLTMISFRFVLKQQQPLFEDAFRLPSRTDVDAPLLGGAALFGIGWGLAGYCPGPAIAGLSMGTAEPLIFVACLIIGANANLFLNSGDGSGSKSEDQGHKHAHNSKRYIVREPWKDGPDV